MYFLLAVFFSAFSAHAQMFTGVTTENFTSLQQADTTVTTAVWNVVANRIQPPLTVCLSSPAPGCFPNNETFDVDIGTGSDGVFDTPTYANFGTITHGSGNNMILTINTNLHPFFNFTTFNVPSNWTIQGAGSNALWFKVQGSFTNAGTITCQGGNGGDVTANIAVGGAGGIGVCGGANGGTGGFAGPTDGANGGDGGAPTDTHGIGGVTSTASLVAASGGGGGGAYGTAGNPTSGGGGIGGGAGTSTPDPTLTNFGITGNGPGGGSGGGGGGAYTFVDAHLGSGGGGGGGGGNIHIACGGDFFQAVGGLITARGGNGGNGVAGIFAGPGGGGGGGTIVIHSGGNIVDNGFVTALTTSPNNNGTTGGGGSAGIGGVGRTWIASLGTFTGSGMENPAFGGMSFGGEVHYKSLSSYVAQSLGYDSLNTSPSFNLFNLTASLPIGSTAILTVAGSNDNFVNDSTGFVPATSVSTLAGKRYFKFNVQLQLAPGGVAAVTPATVNVFTANYAGAERSSFQFSTGCGSFGSPGEFLFDAFLCLFFGFISTGRLRKSTPWRLSRNFPLS